MFVALCAATLTLGGCSRTARDVYQGYVEGEYVYVASSQAGQLSRLAVVRGQSVAAGDLLFTLEAQSESDAVNQAQHQLDAAQAQHADLLLGRRRPEVAVTAAQLEQARAEASRAAAALARDETQFRAGGIPHSQLDDSRATARSSAAKVRELESQLEVARLPGRQQQILAQQAQVQAAQAALAQAQWRLDQKNMHAPHGGLVSDTLYRSGEWVPAGSPVVRLLPPENVKVRFFVPETAVGALKLGSTLHIRCDGCAADVPATLSFVSDQAEYTPPVIYSNETRAKLVFLVEARPRPADALTLHPGQPVQVLLR
ncbi:MAG: HlyD family efflux transporter periplasmic adaptor subunit [Proteobacteria bacterium]|nr:HlyD family efflux transporter periplasmic adaptor subunit [Pseudomonadota bacterium]